MNIYRILLISFLNFSHNNFVYSFTKVQIYTNSLKYIHDFHKKHLNKKIQKIFIVLFAVWIYTLNIISNEQNNPYVLAITKLEKKTNYWKYFSYNHQIDKDILYLVGAAILLVIIIGLLLQKNIFEEHQINSHATHQQKIPHSHYKEKISTNIKPTIPSILLQKEDDYTKMILFFCIIIFVLYLLTNIDTSSDVNEKQPKPSLFSRLGHLFESNIDGEFRNDIKKKKKSKVLEWATEWIKPLEFDLLKQNTSTNNNKYFKDFLQYLLQNHGKKICKQPEIILYDKGGKNCVCLMMEMMLEEEDIRQIDNEREDINPLVFLYPTFHGYYDCRYKIPHLRFNREKFFFHQFQESYQEQEYYILKPIQHLDEKTRMIDQIGQLLNKSGTAFFHNDNEELDGAYMYNTHKEITIPILNKLLSVNTLEELTEKFVIKRQENEVYQEQNKIPIILDKETPKKEYSTHLLILPIPDGLNINTLINTTKIDNGGSLPTIQGSNNCQSIAFGDVLSYYATIHKDIQDAINHTYNGLNLLFTYINNKESNKEDNEKNFLNILHYFLTINDYEQIHHDEKINIKQEDFNDENEELEKKQIQINKFLKSFDNHKFNIETIYNKYTNIYQNNDIHQFIKILKKYNHQYILNIDNGITTDDKINFIINNAIILTKTKNIHDEDTVDAINNIFALFSSNINIISYINATQYKNESVLAKIRNKLESIIRLICTNIAMYDENKKTFRFSQNHSLNHYNVSIDTLNPLDINTITQWRTTSRMAENIQQEYLVKFKKMLDKANINIDKLPIKIDEFVKFVSKQSDNAKKSIISENNELLREDKQLKLNLILSRYWCFIKNKRNIFKTSLQSDKINKLLEEFNQKCKD